MHPIFKVLASALLALGSSVPAQAQAASLATPAPGSEAELLKQIDNFGTGDPRTAQPRSIGDFPRAAKAEKETKPVKKDKGPTEITAREASFDQKTSRATFAIDVVVKDPEFNVRCDKLTAQLKSDKNQNAPAKAPAPPADGPAAKPAPKGGGLERAVAEGNVVISQEKLETDGSISRNIGKAARADYDAVTGNIVLSGWPQVQQGYNNCVAQEEGTVITLNRSGEMKVTGLAKTMIKESANLDKP